MIYKVTNSEIRYYTPEERILQAGYCELSHLLRYTNPKAYNSGMYGWNYDLYELPEGFILTTGYRNMIGARYTDIYEKYENLAKELLNTNNNNFADVTEALYELRLRMTQEIKNIIRKEEG